MCLAQALLQPDKMCIPQYNSGNSGSCVCVPWAVPLPLKAARIASVCFTSWSPSLACCSCQDSLPLHKFWKVCAAALYTPMQVVPLSFMPPACCLMQACVPCRWLQRPVLQPRSAACRMRQTWPGSASDAWRSTTRRCWTSWRLPLASAPLGKLQARPVCPSLGQRQ